MQRDVATGPYGPVADGSSLPSALISLGYSDLSHVMAGFPLPPAFGAETVASSRVGDEFWSTPSAPPYTFEPSKLGVDAMFEAPAEALPFDATAGWVVPCPELHESSIAMNEWMLKEHGHGWLNAINPNPGPPRCSKELSLSLTTSSRPPEPELSPSGVSSHTSCSSLSLDAFPVATLLPGSPFSRAMQEILDEFASFTLVNCDHTNPGSSDRRFVFHNNNNNNSNNNNNNNNNNSSLCGEEMEIESKKMHLMSLLQVVDDQYNQCLDEIHTVISAFHSVTEVDPALQARFALPAVSVMYRDLRERISRHILATGMRSARHVHEEETSLLKKTDRHLWRPQRGLPERSVSVLRAWMFRNFLHPYPKDAEKHLLALKSGLTRSQVSNWFINARVRLWKPMIEEMYAEMNRRKGSRNQEEAINGSHRNLLRFESRRY